MTLLTDEYFIQLATNGSESDLEQLPLALSGHYAKWLSMQYGRDRNIAVERNRLVILVRDNAPHTVLADKIMKLIEQSN